MPVRRPDPFLSGVRIGITLIVISSLFIATWLLITINTGMSPMLNIIIDVMIIIFIVGWIIFLWNLSNHAKPFSMRNHCPFCGRNLAWDESFRVWFCFRCEKRIKRFREYYRL
jgi:hypothetical protein